MEEAYTIAQKKSGDKKLKDKERWDAGATLSCLEVGDRVLVQNKEKGGPGKIRSFWEQQVYRITALKGSAGVVYEIQPEDQEGKGRKRVVHRNMIMPVTEKFSLDSEPPEKTEIRPRKKEEDPVVKKKSRKDGEKLKKKVVTFSKEVEDDSDEDDGFYPCEQMRKLEEQQSPDVDFNVETILEEVRKN